MKPISLRNSYFGRILGYFILTGFLLIIIMCGILYYATDRFLMNYMDNKAEESMKYVVSSFDESLTNYEKACDELSNNQIVGAFLETKDEKENGTLYSLMYRMKAEKGLEADIHILSANQNHGISTGHIPIGYSFPYNDKWGIFRKAKEDKGIVIHTSGHGATMNEHVAFSIAQGVWNADKEFLGYVVIDISRNSVLDIVKTYVAPYQTEIFVTDEMQNIMYASLGEEYEGIGKKELQQIVPDTNANTGVFMEGNYIFAYSQRSNYLFVGEVSRELKDPVVGFVRWSVLVGGAVISILCVVFSLMIAKTITNPVHKLVSYMKQVEKGDFNNTIELKRKDEIGVLGDAFNHMTQKIADLILNVEEKQKRLLLAEVNALQMQINPHFLYNTLDMIKWNAKLGNAEIVSEVTVNLGKLLRKILKIDQDIVPLEMEMEIIKCYAEIQKLRYERLCISYDIGDGLLEKWIPKLLLQPLVENAIVHGFENKVSAGNIYIHAKQQDKYIIFGVKDDGQGIDEERLNSIQQFESNGMYNIGLSNVDARAKMYGDQTCGIKIQSVYGEGTTIILRIKLVEE